MLKLPVPSGATHFFGAETAGSYPGAARLQQALPLVSSFYTRVESLPILGLGLSTAISLLAHDAICSVLCVKPGQHFQSSSSLKLPAHPLVQRSSGQVLLLCLFGNKYPLSPFSECSVLSQ